MNTPGEKTPPSLTSLSITAYYCISTDLTSVTLSRFAGCLEPEGCVLCSPILVKYFSFQNLQFSDNDSKRKVFLSVPKNVP